MKRFFSLFFLIAVVLSGLYAQSDLQTIAIVKLGKTEPITLQQLKARCTAVEFHQREYIATSGKFRRAVFSKQHVPV